MKKSVPAPEGAGTPEIFANAGYSYLETPFTPNVKTAAAIEPAGADLGRAAARHVGDGGLVEDIAAGAERVKLRLSA